jgi:hypothetical protein
VPVAGTIIKPQVDFATAFANTMMRKDTIDSIMNKINEQKSRMKEGKSSTQNPDPGQ